ncbi:hypothetical protein DSM25559_4550 [Agrobacterium rosae]|uniref:Uncharacterized protein n=2 Tax=Agrobacterium rosae TaxID=1972867 RepID=A0A1R3U7U2_9HYPH|nr:hypothetical protein DSM25559_4550 [Agrobacterium rosae]
MRIMLSFDPGLSMKFRLGLYVKTIAGALLMLVSVMTGVSMAETYPTERIFAISDEAAAGSSRKKIDLGETGFSFTTLLDDKMETWTDPGVNDKQGVIAKIYEPENRDKLMIEVHRLRFPSFAEAQVTGYGFLALNGYNRIIQDKAKGNTVFGYLAGSEFDDAKGYSRMARAAVVTHGRDVLVVMAQFGYDDYPELEDTLARFFGGIKMEEASSAFESLAEKKTQHGEIFLYPRDWQLKKFDDTDRPAGSADYSMAMEGNEYPNVLLLIRQGSLEEARKVGTKMISEFTDQVEKSGKASFAGDPTLETFKDENGKVIAHSYARGWDTPSGGPFVSEFYVQKNAAPSTTSIVGLNSLDVRRRIDTFDEETRQILFNGWVTGVSAYSVVKMSLTQDEEAISTEFDLRAVGR